RPGCQQPGRPTVSTRLPLASLGRPSSPVPAGVILPGPAAEDPGLRPPRHILALSSGGLYGAYSIGFLAGWTKTGTRPEFDVVTGISVGSLVAPYAFLGPEYDDEAMNISTGVRAEDVYRIRFWLAIPFKDAVASSAPLRRLVRSQVTQELLDRIAQEHRKGRRLYIGTTDLASRRRVVWDMGAIASLPPPTAGDLFCDVLVASCSVPGMLPPVAFSVPGPDGEPVTELHVDGGVTSPIFVPSNVFRAAEAGTPAVPGANGNLYAVVAGKLYPDARRVKRLVLPVLISTTEALTFAHCRAELGNLYGRTQLAGMRFHMTALRQDAVVNAETLLSIDPVEMSKLYQEGERVGVLGPAWEYGSPELYDPPVEYVRSKHRWRK
ncbi:MAG TPA: patatin-like phospholipase family protein, partial [Gemmata sp.]|nr:patatin-like phospholipase family protein [Gemmata sp.]